MKAILLVVGASLIWLTACSQGTPEASVQSQTEVDTPQVIRVSKASFKTILEANPETILVDVRTPGEYNGGKIGEAINIDFMGESFETKISELDKTSLTLIYCQSGGRSGRALKKMKEIGFTNVRELEGGYSGW